MRKNRINFQNKPITSGSCVSLTSPTRLKDIGIAAFEYEEYREIRTSNENPRIRIITNQYANAKNYFLSLVSSLRNPPRIVAIFRI
jgi:hypothetical protein